MFRSPDRGNPPTAIDLRVWDLLNASLVSESIRYRPQPAQCPPCGRCCFGGNAVIALDRDGLGWGATTPRPCLVALGLTPLVVASVRRDCKATGICHTDEFTLSGADPEGLFRSILGHEGAGIVLEVGLGVTAASRGDHVIPLYTPECRECPSCLSRKTNLCTAIRATQGKGLMPEGPATGAMARACRSRPLSD